MDRRLRYRLAREKQAADYQLPGYEGSPEEPEKAFLDGKCGTCGNGVEWGDGAHVKCDLTGSPMHYMESCPQQTPGGPKPKVEAGKIVETSTDANHPTHASVKSAQRKTVEWDDDDIQSIERAEREKAELENDGYTLVDTVRLGLSRWRIIYEMGKTAETQSSDVAAKVKKWLDSILPVAEEMIAFAGTGNSEQTEFEEISYAAHKLLEAGEALKNLL